MSSTEEAAFWAALAADPTDDNARLVFADWLDDRSDPRSQWIRDAELARFMGPEVDDPTPALIVALQDDDYGVYQPAIALLSRLGTVAVPALLELCSGEEHSAELSRACEALSGMDADALRPHLNELIRLLPIEGYYACGAIAKLGPDAAPAVPTLIDAEERELITGRSLAEVLAAIRPAAEPAVPRLVTIMCWNSGEGSDLAADALVAIGLHTLDAALEGLNHVDHDFFSYGANGIAKYGEAAIPKLTEVLEEPSSPRRAGAVLALGTLAPTLALPHLIEGLRSEHSSYVLELFVDRIASMGPAAAAAAPVLREMLRAEGGSHYHDEVAEALAAVTGDAGIPELVAQLRDPEPVFRRRTLRALAKLAGSYPDARTALFDALKDSDSTVRFETLELLRHVVRRGDEDVPEPVMACLADPEPQIRAAAAGVLGQIKSAASPAIPELIVAMRDPDEQVRIAATQTVDGMQYETPEMLGALLAALDDTSEEVRRAAAHGLQEWGHMYPEHTAAVFARVNDPDPEIAHGATRLIGKATEPTPELIAYLRDTLRNSENLEMRISAAAGLGKLRVTEPEIISAMFALLDETAREELIEPLLAIGEATMAGLGDRLRTRPDLRRAIVRALFWQRGESGVTVPALPGLLSCLSDADDSTRSDAAKVIGDMGHAGAEAVPQLLAQLTDPDQFVRSAAVVALAKVCPTPADVLPAILGVLSDAESYPRQHAMQAIGELGVDAAAKLPHLIAGLRDPEADVQKAAACALEKLETPPVEAVPDLIPILNSSESTCRAQAASTLAGIGPPAAPAMPALLAMLADEDSWARRAAATALGAIGSAAESAVPQLVKLVAEDPEDDVRYAAAEALGQLGATGAASDSVGELVELLWGSDGEARTNAARSLGALGSVARAAVPELARALRDPAWGDISQETRKRFTVMGMSLLPMETLDALASVDQRIYVTMALRQIGPPEAVIPVLAEAMADANAMVANSATEELRELLPASEAALRELLSHPDETVRSLAESALAPPEDASEDEDTE